MELITSGSHPWKESCVSGSHPWKERCVSFRVPPSCDLERGSEGELNMWGEKKGMQIRGG